MIRFLQTEILVINFVIFCVFRGIITHTRHYYDDSKSQGTGVIAQNYGGGYSGEEQSREVRYELQGAEGIFTLLFQFMQSAAPKLHQDGTF